MLKNVLKRTVSLFLAFVLILGLLPQVAIPARAAAIALTGSGIENYLSASYAVSGGGISGPSGSASCNGTTMTIVATGVGTLIKASSTTTVTISNNSADDIVLSFSYSTTGSPSSISVCNNEAPSGSVATIINANSSATVSVTSPNGKGNAVTLTLIDLKASVAADTCEVKFGTIGTGSISVSGKSADNKYDLNTNLAVTATVPSGSQFVGWVDGNNSLITRSTSTTVTCTSDRTINAWFADSETATFLVLSKNTVYAKLSDAISNCPSGDTIVLLTSGKVSESCTIPSGVTLLVPYSDSDYLIGDDSNLPYANSSAVTPTDANKNKILLPTESVFRTLTLDKATLNVASGGAIVVGGYFTGGNGESMAGHTCGNHGNIYLGEGASINLSGVLSSTGYVYGPGSISANSGAKIYQPFIVADFKGGNNTKQMNDRSAVPFNCYTMLNVQSTINMAKGSYMYGYCDLYAASQDNITTGCVMGPIKSNSLLNFTTAQITYTAPNTIPSTNTHVDTHGKIGKTTITLDGDAELGSMSLEVKVAILPITVATSSFHFPIPFNYEIVQRTGTLSVPNKVKIMPGATVKINSGASLVVSNEAAVYDGFVSEYADGTSGSAPKTTYPSAANLEVLGYDARGHLIVDGTATFSVKFGGVIETSQNTGTVIFASGSTNNVSVPEGEKSTYSFTAKLVDYRDTSAEAVKLITPTAGTTYYAMNGETHKYTGGNTSDTEEEIAGEWVTDFRVTFVEKNGEQTQTLTEPLTYAYGASVSVPGEITKTGYTLKSLTDADDKTEYTYDSTKPLLTMPRKDLVLIANWEANEYTISFETYDGSDVDAITQAYGSEITAPKEPTQTGYTFGGWYTDVGFSGDPYSFDKMPAENLTLYAKWTKNKYNVSFVDEDGTAFGNEYFAKTEYEYAATVTLPTEIPQKAGYTFTGWDDGNGGFYKAADVAAGSAVLVVGAANITLTAQWTPADDTAYTIETYTMGTDGKYGDPERTTGTGTTEQTVEVTPAAKEGFTLDTKNSVLSGTIAGDGSLTLKVYYSRNQHTLTFEPDGGTFADQAEKQVTLYYGETYSTMPGISRTGYEFKGWGESDQTSVTMGDADITLTAKWQVLNFTITYLDGTTKLKKETYAFGADVQKYTPEKAGYTFSKWTPAEPKTMPAENLVLSAGWTANTISVTLNQNYGQNPATQTVEVTFGQPYGEKLPAQQERAGYTFDGWKNSNGETVTAESVVTNAENHILYAQWEAGNDTKYTVETYVMGTDGQYSVTIETKTGITDTMADVRPEEKTGFTVAKNSVLSGTITGDGKLVLEVYYARNQYSLTFNVDQGIMPGDEESGRTLYFEEAYGELPEPTREGYTFKDWGEGVNETTIMGASDMVLTARWEANTNTPYTIAYYEMDTNGNYPEKPTKTETMTGETERTATVDQEVLEVPAGFTLDTGNSVLSGIIAGNGGLTLKVYFGRNTYELVFVSNDGSPVDTISARYGAEVSKPADPTKTGYTFGDWYADEKLSGNAYQFTTMPLNGAKLYAKWNPAEDTKYTIQTYTMGTDGIYGAAVETIQKGKTGDSVTLTPTADTGFAVDETQSKLRGEIAADGSLVLKVYFKRNTYTVTFHANDETESPKTVEQLFTYGSKGKLQSFSEMGISRAEYAFEGWNTKADGSGDTYDDGATIPAQAMNMDLYAKWSSTKREYTVEHLQQNLDGTGYTKVDTETKTGLRGEQTAAEAKTYEGFTAQEITQVTIPDEGKAVVVVQYNRVTRNVTFDSNGGSKVSTITDLFGKTITAPADPTKTGYIFGGWYTDEACETAYTFSTMPADSLMLYAKWNPAKDTAYTIEIYTMGTDGVYGAAETETATGETEREVTFVPDTRPGFTLDQEKSVLTGTVQADGGLVLQVYYSRNQYTLTFAPNGGTFADQAEKQVTLYYDQTYSTMPEISRAGYGFKGWDDPAQTSVTMGDEDMTLTAQWEANTDTRYTVAYYVMDTEGNYPDAPTKVPKTGTTDSDVTETPEEKDGFTVAEGSVLTGKVAADGSLLLQVYYARNTYSLTFASNGGTAVGEISARYEAAVSKPANPTKTGYTFDGWYADENLSGGEYEFTTMPLNGAKLYAKWEPAKNTKYTVETYTMGTDGTYTEETKTWTGTTDSKIELTPTAEEGFTLDKTQSVLSGMVQANGSLVLQVYYARNTYSLTFETNGGTPVAPISALYGATVTMPDDPTKTGYVFAGWYSDAELHTAAGTTMPLNGAKLYAKWEPAKNTKYTVETYTMGTDGTYGEAVQTTETGTTGDPVTLTPTADTGFTLDSQSSLSGEIAADGSLVLKVYFSRNQHTLTFVPNGGTFSDEVQTEKKVTLYYGQTYSDMPDISRTGYSFAGWGDPAQTSITMDDEDRNLTAQWTAKQTTVKFWSNAGSSATGSMDAQTFVYDTAQKLSANQFQWSGHHFTGWNTNDDGSGTAYSDEQEISDLTGGTVNLFAQWDENAYTVSFDPNGGTGSMDAQSFAYGQAQNLTANEFTKEGYRFNGWKTEDGSRSFKDGEQVNNLTTANNGTVVLQAQWIIGQFTMSFDTNGGTPVNSITQDYNTAVSLPKDPTRAGHRFDGWSVDGQSVVSLPETMPGENVTYKALWTSYLDLLTAIPSNGFSATLETERGYYSLLSEEQRNTYATNYADHKAALFAAIKVVATAELRESIESDETIGKTNAMLMKDGSPYARLDPTDAEKGIVTVWIDDSTFPAINLLNVDFLPTLFNNPDIQNVMFPQMEGLTDSNGNAVSTSSIDQMQLMLHVAYVALHERAEEEGYVGYDQFSNWLRNNMDITIGAMDGAEVQAKVNAVTPEGVTYDRTYTLIFHNVSHKVIWDLDHSVGGVRQQIVKTYAQNEVIQAPEAPDRPGYEFVRWDGFTAGTTMALCDQTYKAIWSSTQYDINYDLAGGNLVGGTNPATYTVETPDFTLKDPVRDGYTFAGWTGSNGETPETAVTVAMGTMGELTYTANWSPVTYTVTYDLASGALPEDQSNPETYTIETPGFVLTEPVREGHTFTGWTGSNGSVPQKALTIVQGSVGDRSYTANWSTEGYTVAFDANGGKVDTATKVVTYGKTFGALPVPTRIGYAFRGWFTAAEGGDQITADSVVGVLGDSYKLYAQWTVNTYTVTFDANGGEGTMKEQVFTFDVEQELSANDFTMTGHSFAGWKDTAGNLYTDQQAVSNLTSAAGGTVKLTAQWTADTYTVKLDADDGSELSAITVTYGKTYADGGLTTPTREGYGFDGWFTAKTGGTKVQPNDTVDVLAASTTLYARWTAGAYNLTYTNDDGMQTVTSNPTSYTVESADIVLSAPVRSGYTFLGWTYDDVTEPVETVTISTGSTGDRSFIANWSMDTYSIEYEGVDPVDENPVEYTVMTETFTLINPVREGHTFLGWSGTSVNGLSRNVEIAKGSTGDRSYKANWQINKHTVTYYVDGELYQTVQNVEYGTELTAIAAPSKAGYGFSGWQGLPATMPDKDVTVSGTFTANTYTIIFDGNGGTGEMENQILAYGTVQPLNKNGYEKTGYTFGGWSYNGKTYADGEDVLNLAESGTVTLTAVWTADLNTAYTVKTFTMNPDGTYGEPVVKTEFAATDSNVTLETAAPAGFRLDAELSVTSGTVAADGSLILTVYYAREGYTLTWDLGDESLNVQQTVLYGAPIATLDDPVREGYTFNGWKQTVPATMPANDLTIGAKWNAKTLSIFYYVDGELYKTSRLNYGLPISLEPAPTKEGYAFSGWSEVPATMPAVDLEVYGTFTPESYLVTFDLNYDTVETVTPLTVTFDGTYGELPEPERTGYEWIGWQLDNAAVTQDTVVSTAKPHTLVAQWMPKQYTIYLDPNGGTVEAAAVSVTYDQPYSLPQAQRDGYTLVGWYYKDEQTKPFASADTVKFTDDVYLIAKWNVNGDTPFTVKHYFMETDGETYVLEEQIQYGETNSTVEATPLNRDGFRLNPEMGVLSGVIAGDGTLILELYYDRTFHTVQWKVGETVITEQCFYGTVPDAAKIDTSRPADPHGSYVFLGWDKEISTVTGDVVYTAQYETRYEVSLINGDGTIKQTYATLRDALEQVTSGTIRLERDATLTSNSGSGMEPIFLKPGVTLVIPCVDQDPGYVKHGSLAFNHDNMDASAKGSGADGTRYRTLTISSDVLLIVQGTVLVNSVSGRPYGGNNEMDVTGGYGEIQLEGQIMLARGGVLDCFGYVRGDGLITATNGSTVGDLFVVRNWRGGTVGLAMFEEMIYPMNESDCRNIEADLKIEAGAKLEGLVKMYAGNSYNYTRFPQVDQTNGLFRLETGSYVMRSYDSEEEREVYEIVGGSTFASSTLTIVGIPLTTADFLYPIDGDMDIVLNGGEHSFVNDYKFMPGATLTAKNGAAVTVETKAIGETVQSGDISVDEDMAPDVEGIEKPDKVVSGARDGLVTVAFYKTFNDQYSDGTAYPSDYPPAMLTLEKGTSFTNLGIFSGIVYTEEDNIFVSEDQTPVWSLVARESSGDGAHGNAVGQRHQDIPVNLELYRDGYDWRFGQKDLGEVEGSIIWYQGGMLSVIAQNPSASEKEVTVQAKVYNTTDVTKSCDLYVAAYDESGKLLAAEIRTGYVLEPNQFSATHEFVMATDGKTAKLKFYLLDSGLTPMSDAVSVSAP